MTRDNGGRRGRGWRGLVASVPRRKMLTKMLAEPQREWTAQGLGAVAGVAESTSYDALKAMQSVGWVSSRLEGVSEHQGRQPRGPRLTYWRLTDLGRREAG